MHVDDSPRKVRGGTAKVMTYEDSSHGSKRFINGKESIIMYCKYSVQPLELRVRLCLLTGRVREGRFVVLDWLRRC